MYVQEKNPQKCFLSPPRRSLTAPTPGSEVQLRFHFETTIKTRKFRLIHLGWEAPEPSVRYQGANCTFMCRTKLLPEGKEPVWEGEAFARTGTAAAGALCCSIRGSAWL